MPAPWVSSPAPSRTTAPAQQTVSIRSEPTTLRSSRLRPALAACATTTGGVLATYSYIAPLLTDQAGIASGLVPLVLVLVGFVVGALVGSIVRRRLGDSSPRLRMRRPRGTRTLEPDGPTPATSSAASTPE
ncbi:hypothetical protein [Streptomyces milbemycinicus]|uniref:Lipopolysaccharide assembly protein A domain-containing protein n=1 Tax=Streptomyces milbemycinicus TaxID=476552 RepID=A0ABW8LCI7_9ACTN